MFDACLRGSRVLVTTCVSRSAHPASPPQGIPVRDCQALRKVPRKCGTLTFSARGR
ncbi:hypothetical protein CPB85DRAFT_1347809 [Mucidula mucida]|nr:hypothetical protein CPB85DRAFT_1347809 [Mucidula mucida]